MKEFALKLACVFDALCVVMAFSAWAEGGMRFVPAVAVAALCAANTCGTYRAAEYERLAAKHRRAAALADRIALRQIERPAVSGPELIAALVRWYPMEDGNNEIH